MTQPDSAFRKSPAPVLLMSAHNEKVASNDFLRRRYLRHLGHDLPLKFQGYLPDIEPIIAGHTHPPKHSILEHEPESELSSGSESSPTIVPADIEDGSKLPLISGGGTAEEKKFFEAGSIKGSVFNLASSTLGAGALALPYAVQNSGLLLGVIFLVVAAIATVYSIRLLIRIRDSSGYKSYEEVSVNLYGRAFGIFVEVNIVVFCFGTVIAYIVAIGDIIQPLADKYLGGSDLLIAQLLCNKAFTLTLYTVVIILPLCLIESMNSLRFTSLMGVLSICYLVATVAFQSGQQLTAELHNSWDAVWSTTHLVGADFNLICRGFSIFLFAFSCQTNVLSIYEELARRSQTRMKKVANRATSVALSVYVVMGVFGYLMFRGNVNSNIITNFKDQIPGNWAMAVAEAVMTFTLVLALPLNVFPCRYTIDVMLFYNKPYSRLRMVVITVVTVIAALVLAIFCKGINIVFELLGGTASAFVCFVLPAMFFCKLCPGPLFSRQKLPAIALIVAGTAVGTLSTTYTVMDMFS